MTKHDWKPDRIRVLKAKLRNDAVFVGAPDALLLDEAARYYRDGFGSGKVYARMSGQAVWLAWLVSACTFAGDPPQQVFSSVEDYDARMTEPVAWEALTALVALLDDAGLCPPTT